MLSLEVRRSGRKNPAYNGKRKYVPRTFSLGRIALRLCAAGNVLLHCSTPGLGNLQFLIGVDDDDLFLIRLVMLDADGHALVCLKSVGHGDAAARLAGSVRCLAADSRMGSSRRRRRTV